MTLVSNPNGLLISSALFALAGIAVLARIFWTSNSATESDAERRQRKSDAQVASWFGLPMLGMAAFLQGAGQFVTGPLGAGLACLLLALALALALYAALGDMLPELLLSTQRDATAEPARRPLLAPPKLIAVEVHDPEDAVKDAGRHALPA